MSRYNFFLFAAVLMTCVYVSNANPVKRQAEMDSDSSGSGSSGSGSSGSGSSGSGSSGSGSSGSGSSGSGSSGSDSSGSDSSAPTPAPGSDTSSSDSGSGSSGSGSSGSDSFTTGGLLATIARFIEKLPIVGVVASPITNPILINMGKFLG